MKCNVKNRFYDEKKAVMSLLHFIRIVCGCG